MGTVSVSTPGSLGQFKELFPDETKGNQAADLLESVESVGSEAEETFVAEEAEEVEDEKTSSSSSESSDMVVSELPDLFGSEPTQPVQSAQQANHQGQSESNEVDTSPDADQVATPKWNGGLDGLSQTLADEEWKERIKALTDMYVEVSVEHRRAMTLAKELKKEMDDRLKTLIQVTEQGPRRATRNDSQQQPAGSVGYDNQSESTSSSTEEAKSFQQSQIASSLWRAADIEKLGLGESLTERLKENNIDTIGELEDLRAEIALGKSKWPKGIGEAKITKIENAVLEWLAENQCEWGHAVSSVEQPSQSQLQAQTQPQTQSKPRRKVTVEIDQRFSIAGQDFDVGEYWDCQEFDDGSLSVILSNGVLLPISSEHVVILDSDDDETAEVKDPSNEFTADPDTLGIESL